MDEKFQLVFSQLFNEQNPAVVNPTPFFEEYKKQQEHLLIATTAAFLISLTGERSSEAGRAIAFLRDLQADDNYREWAGFFLRMRTGILKELTAVYVTDATFAQSLEKLIQFLRQRPLEKADQEQLREHLWEVFFPEGVGLFTNPDEQIARLRQKRTVSITRLNPQPIERPLQEILFTGNVLLTTPLQERDLDRLSLPEAEKRIIHRAMEDPQEFWYDHPIPIGIAADKNEFLYGLQGLEEMVEFEKRHGFISPEEKLTCVVSVSVTHPRLQSVARDYLAGELKQKPALKNLDIYVFTEADTRKIIQQVLAPMARQYLTSPEAEDLLTVWGVDGEYGRHYSFLKAISPFWQLVMDARKRATFKIDMDQVFPQEALVKETGQSALQHFQTSLWGAAGVDSFGEAVELGMIAGALVNHDDVGTSIFTPDVGMPARELAPDELIFFSKLPQAISTMAEMMTRYGTQGLDGKTRCIERIHVTGGTNGILNQALRKFRPFTPSFFGRAEDQAFILSTIERGGTRLGYAHKDGLIMRHDKHAFAQEAIARAEMGKLLGDYVRILYFSHYARLLTEGDIWKIKRLVDPFTGCFISRIPQTVTLLRFALKSLDLAGKGELQKAHEFLSQGIKRLDATIQFTSGENSPMRQQFVREKAGWELYYNMLAEWEKRLQRKEVSARQFQQIARGLVETCRIH